MSTTEKAWFMFRVSVTVLMLGGGAGGFSGAIFLRYFDFPLGAGIMFGIVIGCIAAWWLSIADVRTSIRDSKKRVRDPNYVAALRKLGYKIGPPNQTIHPTTL